MNRIEEAAARLAADMSVHSLASLYAAEYNKQAVSIEEGRKISAVDETYIEMLRDVIVAQYMEDCGFYRYNWYKQDKIPVWKHAGADEE